VERLIVSPSAGVFHRFDAMAMSDGATVNRGDVIGAVWSLRTSTPVLSPFDGVFMAMLAHEGERLRPGQPVAWLRMSAPVAG
jgi:biotin carboxyl carrier protein